MQKIIAKNIKKLRNLHNMSLSELAQKIAMSPGNLSRIERGELNITIKILEKNSANISMPISRSLSKL